MMNQERTSQKAAEPGDLKFAELPPFMAQAAVYRDRLRMAKAWCIGVTLTAAALLTLQEFRCHGALSRYTSREILIVPGAVDFMRVRPNILPDNVVYYFAEYIAEGVGTFNHNGIEAKAKRLSEFFTPSFSERYLADIRKSLPALHELNVTEVFTPVPASKFQILNDESGTPHYVVNVQGRLDRYSNDTKLISEQEIITVKFRTTRVQPDKPWFFEVEEISRKSRDEYARDESARERLKKP
jgi:hypothetical protein